MDCIEKYKQIYWRKRKLRSMKDEMFLVGLGKFIQETKSSDTSVFYPTPLTPKRTLKFFGEKFIIISEISWRIQNSYSIYITTMDKYYEIICVTEKERQKIIQSIFEGDISITFFNKKEVKNSNNILRNMKDWLREHGFENMA